MSTSEFLAHNQFPHVLTPIKSTEVFTNLKNFSSMENAGIAITRAVEGEHLLNFSSQSVDIRMHVL